MCKYLGIYQSTLQSDFSSIYIYPGIYKIVDYEFPQVIHHSLPKIACGPLTLKVD